MLSLDLIDAVVQDPVVKILSSKMGITRYSFHLRVVYRLLGTHEWVKRGGLLSE